MAYSSTLTSVLHNNAPGLKNWVKTISSNTRFITLQPGRISPEILVGVQEALLKGRALEAEYQARGRLEPKTYLINPLGLSLQDSNIYLSLTLVGQKNKDPMVWPLHRFKSVKLNWADSVVPEDFDIRKTNVQKNLVGLYSEATIHLKLRLNLVMYERLSENPLCADQIVSKQNPEGWLLECNILPSQGLDLWILSQGANVEILAPVEQRERIASEARKMAGLYGTQDALSLT